MRLQDSQANCGPTALHNALAALGIRRSPAECERLCATTATEGTPADNLQAAAKSIRGCHPVVMESTDPTTSIWALFGRLAHRPAILCVDADQHYIAAIGLLGDRFLVADGAHNDLVLPYSSTQLLRRWGPAHWALVL